MSELLEFENVQRYNEKYTRVCEINYCYFAFSQGKLCIHEKIEISCQDT